MSNLVYSLFSSTEKHLSKLIVSLLFFCFLSFGVFFTNAQAGSFFETNVISDAGRFTSLRSITMKSYKIQNTTDTKRYSKARYFIAQVKTDTIQRYTQWSIDSYEFADIHNELSYLVHSLNEYFHNIELYEKTRNVDFKSMSLRNLTDIDASYNRLTQVTQAAIRR